MKLRLPLLLRVSAALTIVGLAFMVWSILQPTPLPVMLAMSVGQFVGMLAFGLYLYVIVVDLRRERRARRDSMNDLRRGEP
jgi:hypothetical protein